MGFLFYSTKQQRDLTQGKVKPRCRLFISPAVIFEAPLNLAYRRHLRFASHFVLNPAS
jgi:hypothetical protein